MSKRYLIEEDLLNVLLQFAVENGKPFLFNALEDVMDCPAEEATNDLKVRFFDYMKSLAAKINLDEDGEIAYDIYMPPVKDISGGRTFEEYLLLVMEDGKEETLH